MMNSLTLLTFFQAFLSASFFFSSSSLITEAIFSLSLRTIRFFFIKSLYYRKKKYYELVNISSEVQKYFNQINNLRVNLGVWETAHLPLP